MSRQTPVLIVGGGIVGLTLGQALKKKGIPFEIYERDQTPDARGQGWAITLHWALNYLKQMLPEDVIANIQEAQVDPEVARNDKGNFLFLNLENGEAKFKIPPNVRWRVNREKMRLALLRGIEERVHWGRRVVGVDTDSAAGKVELLFNDNSSVEGALVVGIEGSKSTVRQILRPDAYSNFELPIRFTGVSVDLTAEQIKPLRDNDPLLFQGCHPPTGNYLWFSTLETPLGNGTHGSDKEMYRAQINISWPVKGPEDEVALTDAERLANMKARASGFAPAFRDAVNAIPEGTPVAEIKLADWECLDWDNMQGLVTLAGDAAHAMTMYRGEAANHGILDALRLSAAIERIYSGAATQKDAINAYEKELRERTRPAVLLSRQACYDAHDWDKLNENSAILKRRAIVDP